MKLKNKSLFNLIEIFKSSPKRAIKSYVPAAHCDEKQIHDYYCDAEKPFIGYNS